MKKGFSILFSIILLASHMNLTIGTHFCNGNAVKTKIMLGEMSLSCGIICMDDTCGNTEKPNARNVHIENVPCCENEFRTFRTTDDFVKDAAQISFIVDFTIMFFYNTMNLDLFPKASTQSYSEYKSPPHETDIQVLFQTFLI